MDDEVLKMINEQYDRAKSILTEHKEGHAQLADLLVSREVIFAEDVERIFGKRPWASRAEELLEAQLWPNGAPRNWNARPQPKLKMTVRNSKHRKTVRQVPNDRFAASRCMIERISSES